jgi:ribosomal protein L37AE/L43A
VYVALNCFRCDGKGKYRNQFGIWEKCESCQKKEMSFDSANPEPDVNEEGL